MRKVILRQPGHFTETHVPRESIKPGEVLVRIHRIGVCGSDLHAFAGRHPAYSYPRVIGHELSCEVIAVPENESRLRTGDFCAIDSFLTCGACIACLKGRGNCCENLQYLGIHLECGMQGFLSLPVDKLHRSEKLTLDQLALIEPLGVGANAVLRGNVQKDEELLVVGAGPIGLASVQFAKAIGAQVRVLELREERREIVTKLGVEVIDKPDGRFASVVIDATGSRPAMEQSFSYVAPGGRLVFVGLVSGQVAFEDWLFHKREMTVLASRASLNLFPRIIRMIEDGQIDPSVWITDRMGLADVPSPFQGLPDRPGLVKHMVEVNESAL
jgi:2-desacetyl-2-hydroxyethyl bacteriochlorophyllide A dehydrogenase